MYVPFARTGRFVIKFCHMIVLTLSRSPLQAAVRARASVISTGVVWRETNLQSQTPVTLLEYQVHP